MKLYNKTILIGRLGNDPELASTSDGTFAKFSICNSTFENGEEKVQWHNIIAVGKQANVCMEHLHKGDLCCIEGHLDTLEYESDGETFYKHQIIAERIVFLRSKN